MNKMLKSLKNWIKNDNDYELSKTYPDQIDWLRALPFILIHLSCLLVFITGFSWTAFASMLVLYFVRLFSIGAFYHRYFSHKTYKTNRCWQFIFALIAASSAQRGPLWWASHHRQHHLCADEVQDVHSPVHHGFWWSHLGWFLSKKNYHYNPARIADFSKFPELVFLDHYDVLAPALLFISLWIAGFLLQLYAPGLRTSPGQMVVWGFCISTVALFHTTVTINSLSHIFGRKRFATPDNSRNNWFLALLTLGEGWHNNHHHYPASSRQGFMWWELDITYYLLKLLEKLGIIHDIKNVPKDELARDRLG